jgi:hypothetical protein
VTDPTPSALQGIDVEAWRIHSKEEMRVYIDSLKARRDRTKQTKSRQAVQFLQFDKISRPLIYTVSSRRDLETQMGFKRFRPARPFRVKVGNPADATHATAAGRPATREERDPSRGPRSRLRRGRRSPPRRKQLADQLRPLVETPRLGGVRGGEVYFDLRQDPR